MRAVCKCVCAHAHIEIWSENENDIRLIQEWLSHCCVPLYNEFDTCTVFDVPQLENDMRIGINNGSQSYCSIEQQNGGNNIEQK